MYEKLEQFRRELAEYYRQQEYMMALSLWEIHEIKVTKNKKTGIKITTHTQNQNEY
jgi:hypothetical protein